MRVVGASRQNTIVPTSTSSNANHSGRQNVWLPSFSFARRPSDGGSMTPATNHIGEAPTRRTDLLNSSHPRALGRGLLVLIGRV